MKKNIFFFLSLTAVLFLTCSSAKAVVSNDIATQETPAPVVKSINVTTDGPRIKWTVDGYSKNGFKVVWSKNPNPTYPTRDGDKYHYYPNPATYLDTIEAFAGEGIYYIRVCEYLGGKCGVYSNEVTFKYLKNLNDSGTDSTNIDTTVKAIYLNGDGKDINWKVDGYSKNGFKVVWSKNPEPTYPTRDGDKYHYFAEPAKNSDTLELFNGAGIYYARVCEYLDGKCGIYSNEIKIELREEIIACTQNYEPVCGVDNKTYSNSCLAEKQAGIKIAYQGECKLNTETNAKFRFAKWQCYDGTVQNNNDKTSCKETTTWKKYAEDFCQNKCLNDKCGVNNFAVSENCDNNQIINNAIEIKQIETTAENLNNGKIEAILQELNELRNKVKEQEVKIKYLTAFNEQLIKLSPNLQASINQFITYGVDANTKKLGEGERAAVINSYKEAYGNLPTNETELADAIKIANGRWPSEKSVTAENKAKENFKEIYQREPATSNTNDNAAVTIMAYGLKQKAENRKLSSEQKALNIYKNIYNKTPKTTEDWNNLQAITYSGAKR